MNFALIFAYIASIILFIAIIHIITENAEYIICAIRHKIPFVPSARVLRNAVVAEINTHYPNMKTACDIGAGYGELARMIARKCNMRVTALENMPVCAAISYIADFMSRANTKTVWCDAFKYLGRGARFDIGVAYLGPGVNDQLAKYKNNFRVLITLDVPVAALRPARIIDVGHGGTRYGKREFPHKLFVYEFDA